MLKLGLQPSFILNTKSLLLLDLNVGILNLSPQHWTCHFEAGPSAQLHPQHQIGNVSGLARCDIGLVIAALDLSSAIGLVMLKLGLWPRFILDIEL